MTTTTDPDFLDRISDDGWEVVVPGPPNGLLAHGSHDQQSHGNWSSGSGVFDAASADAKNLTREEAQALADYINTDYTPINAAARGEETATAKTQAQIDHIDSAIRNGTPTHGATLYRGIWSGRYNDAQPGQPIRDKGFMSTTINPQVATRFKDTHGSIIEIHTRPETKVIRGNDTEEELILARNTKLRVLHVEERLAHYGRPYTHIIAEVIP